MDDADKCTADVPLCPLDINSETGTAHERDSLLRQKWLKSIEVVTDGAVRHIQKPRKCEEFERLVRHKEPAHKNRATLFR